MTRRSALRGRVGVGGTWQILEASVALGRRELALIEAQDRLDGPRGEITLHRVG